MRGVGLCLRHLAIEETYTCIFQIFYPSNNWSPGVSSTTGRNSPGWSGSVISRRGFFFRRMHVAGRKRKLRNGLKPGALEMIQRQPDGCRQSPAWSQGVFRNRLRPEDKNGARYTLDNSQDELRAIRNREKWIEVDRVRNEKELVDELKLNSEEAFIGIIFPK